ncbi:MAG: hypothetical protein HYV33_04745 [Candidatus Kerfeldbacteria bacterium]|nr:hypothetical protein [Candidatus Kerfeldbacteria bacterium]
MDFPYAVFEGVYVFSVLGCMVFFGLNFYHLIKFGFFDFTGKLITVLVLGIFAVTILFTIIMLREVDWTSNETLFDNTLDDLPFQR